MCTAGIKPPMAVNRAAHGVCSAFFPEVHWLLQGTHLAAHAFAASQLSYEATGHVQSVSKLARTKGS